MRTKVSVVVTQCLFYQNKKVKKMSHQVSSHGQLFRPYFFVTNRLYLQKENGGTEETPKNLIN